MIDQAGVENCFAPAKMVSAWLLDQLEPLLDHLRKAAKHNNMVLAAEKEFAEFVGDQLEIVGTHQQQLKAIYHKHKQSHETAELG